MQRTQQVVSHEYINWHSPLPVLPDALGLLRDRVQWVLKARGELVGEEALETALWDTLYGDLMPRTRLVLRSDERIVGQYQSATDRLGVGRSVGAFERWGPEGEQDMAQEVLRMRMRMEREHGLIHLGYAPVSVTLALLPADPDLPLIGWMGQSGDNTDFYGPVASILRPEVIERTVLTLGDSFNLFMQDALHERLLSLEQATVLAATQGMFPWAHRAIESGDEVEYIEGMVLGGLHESDIEQVVILNDGPVRLSCHPWHALPAFDQPCHAVQAVLNRL